MIDTALLNPILNWERVRYTCIIQDDALHIFMKEYDHLQKLRWTSYLMQQYIYLKTVYFEWDLASSCQDLVMFGQLRLPQDDVISVVHKPPISFWDSGESIPFHPLPQFYSIESTQRHWHFQNKCLIGSNTSQRLFFDVILLECMWCSTTGTFDSLHLHVRRWPE